MTKAAHAPIRVLTRDELDERRRQLLSKAGCSLYELRERAREYKLTLDELEIVRELERLEFLAGH